MTNHNKAKGTRAESAVVTYLNAQGFNGVERRTLAGANDRGDIAGLPGVVVEVKDHNRTELAVWVDESQAEVKNARAAVGVVWHKRRGKGSPGAWYVTMTGADLVELLKQASR